MTKIAQIAAFYGKKRKFYTFDFMANLGFFFNLDIDNA